MANRVRIAAGNWKMNTTVTEGTALAATLAAGWTGDKMKRMLVAPPFTHLIAIQESLQGSTIQVAAQNCHWEKEGAFTGEISPKMLRAMGIEFVILGHSERRELFEEDNTIIRKKTEAALAEGLRVIFCCGEPLGVRKEGGAKRFVESQLNESLLHLTVGQMQQVIVAYEPIWAIGTGVTATADQAQEMHAFIRTLLETTYSPSIASETTILYGGSVKPGNAAELFGKPDVDGGLVGGASLNAADFLQIASAL